MASFGFVYIHPLADGNGREHRFLINDILRRDGAVPAPLILPVSSVISGSPADRRAYDQVLDQFSAPLMQRYRESVSLTEAPILKYADGIRSSLKFSQSADAMHAWRFMDLTAHVAYLAEVVVKTISHDMRIESLHLQRHARARTAVKDILEMPDPQADRVIRSVEAQQGRLSGKLAQEIPALTDHGVWADIVSAVRLATDPSEADGEEPPGAAHDTGPGAR